MNDSPEEQEAKIRDQYPVTNAGTTITLEMRNPPWVYKQSTGQLYHNDKVFLTGYAGNDKGLMSCKNNPDMQDVHKFGPLPRGDYEMEAFCPEGDPTRPHLGIGIIPLKPAMTNQMFGRSGFYIHGDSMAHPGEASDGCIVIGHEEDRRNIWDSGDHLLRVVE